MAFADSLIGYYKFDSNINDSSGKGHNASYTFSTLGAISETLDYCNYVAAKYLNGITTSGIGIYNSVSDFNFGTGSFSVSFWWKPAAEEYKVIGNFDSTTNSWYIDQKYESGPDRWAFGFKVGTIRITGDITAIGAWHHVACTFDGTNQKIYINGVLASSAVNTVGTNVNSTVATFVGLHGGSFDGIVDDLGFWKGYAISSGEVTSINGASGDLSTVVGGEEVFLNTLSGATISRGTTTQISLDTASIAAQITDDAYFSDPTNWKEVRFYYGPGSGHGGFKNLRFLENGTHVFADAPLTLTTHARTGIWALKMLIVTSYDNEKYGLDVSLLQTGTSFTVV
jgi:hypothetical protein